MARTSNWGVAESDITPESVFLNRRKFLASTGATIAGLGLGGCVNRSRAQQESSLAPKADLTKTPTSDLYPAKRNETFKLDRPLTDERVAATYNNFYEFTEQKDAVWKLVEKFEVRPWTVEITGLVPEPKTWDVDELIRKLSLEERLYRHRCVETWAMAVPWTGATLKSLIDLVQPKSSARFVRFVSFLRPEQAPNQRNTYYPWPYYEGLTMAEATNELALLATGIYGHELPKQHGAPIRLVVPWKYGFKSIKSIVRIEFTDKQPPTLWNDLAPNEYSFEANVNPKKPHPRWSQAYEWMIPSRSDRRPTLKYNGYGEYVAGLYS